MDLRFVSRDLKKLDAVVAEVLVAPVMEDERPPRGVAGMVDWRLAGQLSRVMKSGFFKGALGETLLLPTKPAMPFDKTLLFGCGPKADFDERAYLAVVATMLAVLGKLKAGHAVVELPGRHWNAITAERAVDLLLEHGSPTSEHAVWTLVDAAEAQVALNERRLRERRRVGP